MIGCMCQDCSNRILILEIPLSFAFPLNGPFYNSTLNKRLTNEHIDYFLFMTSKLDFL